MSVATEAEPTPGRRIAQILGRLWHRKWPIFLGFITYGAKGGKKSIDGVKTHTVLLENLGKGVLHDIGSDVDFMQCKFNV